MSSSATATAMQSTRVSRPPAGLFVSGEKRSAVLCLALVLLTLAFYNSVVRNGFTRFDDDDYIVRNVHVRAGLTWETVKWSFTSYDAANWHPLTWLSHALDVQIFKLNPAGHHYVTVLLHAVNALLLFLLLEGATGLTWPSFMVAGLFALHPVNVESVAWASERKNVLSMLFFLLALQAYGWYVRRGGVKRYAVVAALFGLGLMAKSEIITLPFVMLLWDYWPLRRMGGNTHIPDQRRDDLGSGDVPAAQPLRSFSFLVFEKAPLFVLAACSGVITMLAQRSGNAMRTLEQYSMRARLGNAVVAYVRYLGKAIWPVRLAAFYPHPGNTLRNWEIVASAAALLLVTAMVVRLRNRRYLLVGWFWFLGTLVPVIGIVQVGEQAMADRYAYLSYVGLFVGTVWGVTELARAKRIAAGWIAVPAVLVLLSLGVVTRRQVAVWYDSEALWRHALSTTERNYFAHSQLGFALAEKGQSEAAIAEFDAAESLKNYMVLDLVAVAAYKRSHGHVQASIAEYDRALAASPDSKTRALVLSRLSSAYMQMGDFSHAKLSCADALRENPNNGSALVDSALLAEHEGDFLSAIAQISRAMQVSPTDVGYVLLAHAFHRAGQSGEAFDAMAHARRISPNFAQAEQDASAVLSSAGISAD